MSEHERFRDDVGAYLLGALDRRERAEFERHMAACEDCREEVEQLRPAAHAVPASVEQLEPPPRLKARLMAEVAPPRPRRSFPRFSLRPVLVAAATGLIIALGIAQLGGDSRTLAVSVDEAMPRAGGSLRVAGDQATLTLHGMPDLGEERVYQVWLQHGDEMVPARTFEIGPGGAGEVEIPDVGDADGVYVTREARGGARVPSEAPIVGVPL